MNKMDSVLKVTKGVDSHVSIYIFEKTKKEIEEIKAQLPKEFYIEHGSLEDDGWTVFRADKFVEFEYVEITVYLKKEDEDN